MRTPPTENAHTAQELALGEHIGAYLSGDQPLPRGLVADAMRATAADVAIDPTGPLAPNLDEWLARWELAKGDRATLITAAVLEAVAQVTKVEAKLAFALDAIEALKGMHHDA